MLLPQSVRLANIHQKQRPEKHQKVATLPKTSHTGSQLTYSSIRITRKIAQHGRINMIDDASNVSNTSKLTEVSLISKEEADTKLSSSLGKE